MKRFALFQYCLYYPSGGWNDCRGLYDTEADAKAAMGGGYDMTQIVDLLTGEVIKINHW
jgi:hypothetical protein